jgi:DNA-binding HxlR family transcriptional regulator
MGDRKKNKESIVAFLSNGPRKYTDIIKEVRLSGPAVNNILQNLMNEGIVYKTFIEEQKEETKTFISGTKITTRKPYKAQKPVYALTETGYSFAKTIWVLLHEVLELQYNGAEYSHGLSSKFGSLGMSHDEIVITNNKQLALKTPELSKIEDLLMQEVTKKIKAGGRNPKPSYGKLLLAFEIDIEKISNKLNPIKAGGTK